MGFKALRLPKLKFFAQPHKGDVAGDASVFAQALRENRTTVLIDGENFGCAEERRGELIALIGVRREVFDQRIDFIDETLAAGVECRRIKRWIAVDAIEPVFGENRTEGSGNGDPALGVDLIRE